jgi:hypothetical protein
MRLQDSTCQRRHYSLKRNKLSLTCRGCGESVSVGLESLFGELIIWFLDIVKYQD